MFLDSIREGVESENPRMFIKWGANIDDLENLNNPKIVSLDKGKILIWSDIECFGGKFFDISIRSDNYINTSGKIERVIFNDTKTKPFKQYEELYKYFFKQIGEPHEQSFENNKYPRAKWIIDSDVTLVIGVSERFVDYSIFFIEKTL